MGVVLCAATACSCAACSSLEHLVPGVFLLHGGWKKEPPYGASLLLQKALGRAPSTVADVQQGQHSLLGIGASFNIILCSLSSSCGWSQAHLFLAAAVFEFVLRLPLPWQTVLGKARTEGCWLEGTATGWGVVQGQGLQGCGSVG